MLVFNVSLLVIYIQFHKSIRKTPSHITLVQRLANHPTEYISMLEIHLVNQGHISRKQA